MKDSQEVLGDSSAGLQVRAFQIPWTTGATCLTKRCATVVWLILTGPVLLLTFLISPGQILINGYNSQLISCSFFSNYIRILTVQTRISNPVPISLEA